MRLLLFLRVPSQRTHASPIRFSRTRLLLAVRRREPRAHVAQPQGTSGACPHLPASPADPWHLPAAQTGHSRHYAWVEFKHPSVAKVAADAMNNYLLAGQVLKVHVVAPSAVHPSTFKGSDKPFRARPRQRTAREAHNAPRSAEQLQAAAQRLVKGEAAR